MINLGPYSGKNCPNIRFHPTLIDRVLEVIAVLIILSTCGIVLWLYFQEEGGIPVKTWVGGGFTLFGGMLIGFSAYAPIRWINFPVRVTERNMTVQYVLALRFCRVLNIVVCLIFLATALMKHYAHAMVLFSSGFVLLGVAFIVYYILAAKYR